LPRERCRGKTYALSYFFFSTERKMELSFLFLSRLAI